MMVNNTKCIMILLKIPQTIDTQKQYTMYCTVQEDALSDYDKPMLSVDYCIED